MQTYESRKNYFNIYDKSFGDRLMAEARQRGITRTEFIRRATQDYLRRNPATGNQDIQKK